MDFQELMLTYGYPMLFLGVLLESEAFLLIGVYLAQKGYFSLPAVIGLAAFSSFCITQLCFGLGHRFGSTFIRTRPRWQLRYQRIKGLIDRYGTGLVMAFRALYGLRGAVPAALGLAGFPLTRFTLYNALGACTWAVSVAFLGGNVVSGLNQLYANYHPSKTTVLFILVGLGILWLVYRLVRQARLRKKPIDKPVIGYHSIPLK
ncbi:DedA family protein [Spirosoma validum]|uniref:DedA family protein n=1 Tax=Spirosoma validum TaxID=2771355 RepID=A0A927B841_9BACT|nr:DedA family protein [Spirosoma validum]MBD2757474.1 DedA family protein [Spirosoma validum]